MQQLPTNNTEESVRLAKELSIYFKKKLELDMEYQNSLATHNERFLKLLSKNQQFLPKQNFIKQISKVSLTNEEEVNTPKDIVLKTSLWKYIIDSVEQCIKNSKEKTKITKEFMDVSFQQFLDIIPIWEEGDAVKVIKEKNLDLKLSQFINDNKISSEKTEKTTKSQETVKNGVLEEKIRKTEGDRLKLMKSTIESILLIEKINLESELCLNSISVEKASCIEVEKDVDVLTKSSSESSGVLLSSLSKNEKIISGKVNLKKENSIVWINYYAVIHGSSLYLFETPSNNELSKEIVNLSNLEVHYIDESYFKKANCFQLIPKTPSPDSSLRKSGKLLIDSSYYMYVNDSAEREKWMSHLYKLCYCCSKCVTFHEFETPANELLKKQASFVDSVGGSFSDITELYTGKKNTSSSSPDLKQESTKNQPSNLVIPEVKNSTNSLLLSSNSNLFTNNATVADFSQKVYPKRFLTIWITDGKELLSLIGSRYLKTCSFYCEILIDDIKQAKSNIVSGGENQTFFWGEEYKLSKLLPCYEKVKVILFGAKNSNDSYREIGYVNLPLDSFKPGKKVEEWFSVENKSASQNSSSQQQTASIRIGIMLSVEQRLPPQLHHQLLEILTEPTFACVRHLDEFLGNTREDFTKHFVNILISQKADLEGIKTLIGFEIDNAENSKILFRGNSIATKSLDQYMKQIGSEYLHTTLHAIIELLFKTTENHEIDINKLSPKLKPEEKLKQIKKNLKSLLDNADCLSYAIFKSVDKFPREFASIFHFIKNKVKEKWPDGNTQYTAISGFIFLRFFCPAVLSPKLFKLMPEHANESTNRMLTLLAKILQNLANLTYFKESGKEEHMLPCDVFIGDNINKVKKFMDQISSEEATTRGSLTETSPKDIKHNTAVVAFLFTRHLPELKKKRKQTDCPQLNLLIPLLNELELHSFEKDSQSYIKKSTSYYFNSTSVEEAMAITPEVNNSFGSSSKTKFSMFQKQPSITTPNGSSIGVIDESKSSFDKKGSSFAPSASFILNANEDLNSSFEDFSNTTKRMKSNKSVKKIFQQMKSLPELNVEKEKNVSKSELSNLEGANADNSTVEDEKLSRKNTTKFNSSEVSNSEPEFAGEATHVNSPKSKKGMTFFKNLFSHSSTESKVEGTIATNEGIPSAEKLSAKNLFSKNTTVKVKPEETTPNVILGKNTIKIGTAESYLIENQEKDKTPTSESGGGSNNSSYLGRRGSGNGTALKSEKSKLKTGIMGMSLPAEHAMMGKEEVFASLSGINEF